MTPVPYKLTRHQLQSREVPLQHEYFLYSPRFVQHVTNEYRSMSSVPPLEARHNTTPLPCCCVVREQGSTHSKKVDGDNMGAIKSRRHFEEYLRLLWCSTVCNVGPYTKSGFAVCRSAKTTYKMNNRTAICKQYQNEGTY